MTPTQLNVRDEFARLTARSIVFHSKSNLISIVRMVPFHLVYCFLVEVHIVCVNVIAQLASHIHMQMQLYTSVK